MFSVGSDRRLARTCGSRCCTTQTRRYRSHSLHFRNDIRTPWRGLDPRQHSGPACPLQQVAHATVLVPISHARDCALESRAGFHPRSLPPAFSRAQYYFCHIHASRVPAARDSRLPHHLAVNRAPRPAGTYESLRIPVQRHTWVEHWRLADNRAARLDAPPCDVHPNELGHWVPLLGHSCWGRRLAALRRAILARCRPYCRAGLRPH